MPTLTATVYLKVGVNFRAEVDYDYDLDATSISGITDRLGNDLEAEVSADELDRLTELCIEHERDVRYEALMRRQVDTKHTPGIDPEGVK